MSTVISTLDRQLDLTINALLRSIRKVVRLAEKEDPAATDGAWKAVEHRCGLLQSVMQAAAQLRQKRSAEPGTEAPRSRAENASAKVDTADGPATPQASAIRGPRPTPSPSGSPLNALLNPPDSSAPVDVDPRYRLLQLLTARAVALEAA